MVTSWPGTFFAGVYDNTGYVYIIFLDITLQAFIWAFGLGIHRVTAYVTVLLILSAILPPAAADCKFLPIIYIYTIYRSHEITDLLLLRVNALWRQNRRAVILSSFIYAACYTAVAVLTVYLALRVFYFPPHPRNSFCSFDEFNLIDLTILSVVAPRELLLVARVPSVSVICILPSGIHFLM